jgi:NADP-dependent 3-hydroxy acid dehydrogenase YdfG
LSTDDFKNDFQINVVGAVAVIQAVLPKLKKADGAQSYCLVQWLPK